MAESPAPDRRPPYPDARFAVISDLHYYAAALGTEGPAFEQALDGAETLFPESDALLNHAIDEILAAGVQFVLVPGDLTKDGEKASHLQLATVLRRLTDQGVPVYAIPGNHDMNNPRSFRYEGERRFLDAAVTPEAFARIHAPFGYSQALLRHDDSLSYVAEPVAGLWLVAVDCTRSQFNRAGTEEIVGGALTPSLRAWLADALQQAEAGRKRVLYMQHHGIVEHWRGQACIHADFLVADFAAIGRMLAAAGVRLAFTGHYHALDITRGSFEDDGFLYDIETGSLTAAPCPIRICTLRDGRLALSSLRLADRFHPGSGFGEAARVRVRESVRRHAYSAARKYRASARDAAYLAEHIADAFMAHYEGDENPALRPAFDRGRLGLWGRFIHARQRYVLENLWQDLPPADDNVTLDLD